MEGKRDILVLYIDPEDNSLHQILLNDLEIAKLSTEITNMFAAKHSPVLVSEDKLKIYKEGIKDGKRSSR